MAKGDDARLLWYLHHAHGSGPAYHMVTITAIRDGAAWEVIGPSPPARRPESEWGRELDEIRHGVTAKMLLPVPWSPMQDIDFAAVPTDGATHELSIYMEDTGWPHAAVDDYVDFWEKGYYRPMKARDGTLLDIQVVFQTALRLGPAQGGHPHAEDREPRHAPPPPHPRGPRRRCANRASSCTTPSPTATAGRSKLLRTSAWSPLY